MGRRSAVVDGKLPWIGFLLVTAVFAVTMHRWGYSVQGEVLTMEWRAQVVATPNLVRRISYPLLGLYGLWALIQAGGRRPKPAGMLGLAMVACAGLAFSSVLWSDATDFSLRRLVSFALFCVGALGLASRSRPRAIALLILVSSGAYLAAGIASEISVGTFRFSPRSTWYRFAGTWHPNAQGLNCALLTLSGVVLGDAARGWWKVFFYSCSGVGFAFLVVTRSRTSFAAVVVAVAAYKLLVTPSSRKYQVLLLAAMMGSGFLLVSGSGGMSTVREGVLLGRVNEEDAGTFSGRVPLWQACWTEVKDRPILGHGFNGFWTPERIQAFTDQQGWRLGSAHSIYVDVALELGLVGFCLFVGILLGSAYRARSLFKSSQNAAHAFLFAFVIFYMCHGFLESIFISPGYFSFLSVLVLAKLGFSPGGVAQPGQARITRRAGSSRGAATS